MNKRITDLFNWSNRVYRFLFFLGRRFVAGSGIYQASALTFTTLLAIVPLMAVSFSVLSAFPLFNDASSQIQNYVFTHFVPATGETVKLYLQQFAEQASTLSVSGMSFLVITAIAMMYTIEQALNEIWGIKRRRHGIAAFLLYWAILTLGPLLLGMSLLLSTYLASSPLLPSFISNIGISETSLVTVIPFFLTIISLLLLYVVVPNTKVSLRYGFTGAVITAILLEFAKYGFTLYLQQYHTYQLLYGAFASIPIFFLWVYLVWVIVLVGAEITHALSAYHIRRLGAQIDPFTHAIFWLRQLWQAQKQGHSLSLDQLISADQYDYQLAPRELIDELLAKRFVRMTHRGEYLLARDLSQLTWRQMHSLLPWKLPDSRDVAKYADEDITAYLVQLKQVEKANEDYLVQPLCCLFE